MNNETLAAYGITINRVGLGLIYLAHSVYLKLFVFTLAGTAQYFESIGLPGFLAYGVFLAEAVGGTALILGYRTRLFAALLVPVALGATWAHLGAGWLFSSEGGGWEFPAFLAAVTASQAMLGDGALALSGARKARPLATAAATA